MTNLEGRVIRRRKTIDAPDGPRSDIDILCDLAVRLGDGNRFAFASAEDVFEEFRRATAAGRADYSGITYAKIDAQDGVCWPCPGDDHPGTPRLFADHFAHADGPREVRRRRAPARGRRAGRRVPAVLRHRPLP